MSDRANSSAAPVRRWSRISNTVRKQWSRFFDWFAVQSRLTRLSVVTLCIAIVASGVYSIFLVRKQAAISHEIAAMAADGKAGDVVGPFNDKLPVVFGQGSILPFLETHAVKRITIVYEPVMWNVSDRIALVESEGKQYAFYPSDLETKIFTDKAVSAPWGSRLLFVPRGDLTPANLDLFERLDKHFANARPQMEKDDWKAAVSGVLSGTLAIGLLCFLYFQLKGQFKSLKFIEASQIQGSIHDLVGMNDIKAEVFQLMDHYARRTEYAEYGIDRPFNVMFSGPPGTGKTKLASYLAKELKLPILFHSAANLETGFVAGGTSTLGRIVAMARRRKRCIVFLDEAQDLFMKRGGRRKFDDDTANTLLSVLDGVRSLNDTEIIWIVASNFNSETMQMDEAMLRRFQMKVDFRLPNKEERLAIITHYLNGRADKVQPNLDLRHLVAVTEGISPAELETIINQAGILAVKTSGMINENVLMKAAERVLVGNVNADTTMERERDRRIIAVHEWGHFLVDLAYERKRTNDDWALILADMKTIKISLKANPRNNALGFVFHKQGDNLLKSKGDIEHDIRVLLGGMANEELFYGEEGVTNGAHNDISRVTKLLHHAVAEVGMYRTTRLNYGALSRDGRGDNRDLDEETRTIMETQSERLYAETIDILTDQKALSAHLVAKLLEDGEMSLEETLVEIRRFEAGELRTSPLPALPTAFVG